ncbi:hypothetical protein HDU98_006345 [Podochytrium sp. JEL0797]|nr:hypothetical protein HDU98_006345 [Podochytrium sp. JEL0797]
MEEPHLDITLVYPGMVDTEIIRQFEQSTIQTKQLMPVSVAVGLIIDAIGRGARNEVLMMDGNLLWYLKDFVPRAKDFLVGAVFEHLMAPKAK